MNTNYKVAIVSVLGMFFAAFFTEASTKLTIQFNQHHQVIDSFGASDA